MEFCLVHRTIRGVVEDSADTDRDPDVIDVTGEVVFEPLLASGDAVIVDGFGAKPVTVAPFPIVTAIVAGRIRHRGEDGIKLFAGGADCNPSRIRYRATFRNLIAGTQKFTLRPVEFEAPPSGALDLTIAQPVAGSPAPGVTIGPPGASITAVDTTPDQRALLVTLTDHTGQAAVLPPVSLQVLEDLKTSVDAASESAQEATTAASTATEQAALAQASAVTSGDSAATATTQAGIATTKAGETEAARDTAQQHAQTAITKAGEADAAMASATQAATTATTQTGIATTKAGEAAAARDEAAGYALTATTKAGEAAGHESAAADHAATATTQAGVATTKAGEAAVARDEAVQAAQSAQSGAPADGWPRTALHQDVRESLSRADTAIQSVPKATPSAPGGIQLTGALGGTWDAPTVPGLTSSVSGLTAAEGATSGTLVKRSPQAQIAAGAATAPEHVPTKGQLDDAIGTRAAVAHTHSGDEVTLTVEELDGASQTMTVTGLGAGLVTVTAVAEAARTRASVPQIIPWDGQGTWTPPPGAATTDRVLNLATGEVHAITEVS